jgi:PKD repeat protein
MTRAITAPELALLRLDRQHTKLFVALPAAPVVFAARVNQTFTSKTRDMCVQVTFDGVTTGAYTDILPGMTVLFGTTAGGWDVGIARVRLAATSTLLKIGEMSDAYLDNDQYITVVRDFAPWACQPRILANTIKMDWGVAYSDQHTKFSPFPVWGSDRVAKLPDGETPTVTLAFDASRSYCPGSTITGYSFSAPGASATADMTTATPDITYNADGTYIVYLTVTAANAKTTTASRIIYIYSSAAPALECELGQCGGSLDSGGWSFGVTLLDGIGATVRPHAKAILFAEEWYGDTDGSLGPLAGSENIVSIGWIGNEGLRIDPNSSQVQFTTYGANYWLARESLFPVNVKSVTGTPAKWDELKNLTFDQFAATFLQNRTTLPNIVDCTLSGDTRKTSGFEVSEGSAWEQINAQAQGKLLAASFCDRYSRFYVGVDPQYVPDKSVLTTVMEITKADREAGLDFERQTVAQTALLMLSGVVYSATTPRTLYALSPGHTPMRFGTWNTLDGLMIDSQTELNALAGDIVGTDNNEFPSIPIELAQNNRFIDCAPGQVCHLEIPAGDNIRGVAFHGNVIPRAIEYRLESGVLRSSVEFEAVCVREMNRKGDIPINEDGDTIPIPETPPFPEFIPEITPPIPPTDEDPQVISRINRVIIREATQGIFYTDTLSDETPLWLASNAGLPAAPSYISKMMVTGYKNLIVSYGALYNDESTYPYSGVWACEPGGTFREILNYDDVVWLIGATEVYINIYVAVSPFDDSVAVIAQSGNKFDGTRKIFVGTSAGGFIEGAEIPRRVEFFHPLTSFSSYGDGVWRLVTHELLDDYTFVYKISADGSTIAYDSGVAHANFGNTNNMHSITTGAKFVLPNCTGEAKITDDNGVNFSGYPSRPANFRDYWQALACDLSGTNYMWASDYPLSTDGGTNWAEFAAFPGTPYYGSRFFYYQPALASLNEWLATIPSNTDGGVVNSVDNGLTWVDRTGDLNTVAEIETLNILEIYGI